MNCEKCGCEIPERAVICPDCGAILPRKTPETEEKRQTVPESASAMSSGIDPSAENPDAEESTPAKSLGGTSLPFLSARAEDGARGAHVEDPRAQQQAQQERRFRRRRIYWLSGIAAVLVLLGVLYGIFFGGYKLAVFRYVKGVDWCNGSMYVSLIPDAYMDYLEDTYDTTRRDVKDMLGDYFTYWNENYGAQGSMSYEIGAVTELSEADCESLSDTLQTSYGIDVEIRAARQVRITIDDGGSKAAEEATFVKIGAKWCCIEAMEDIDFVVQNDGYNVW